MARYEQVPVGELDSRYASLRLTKPEVVSSLARSIARHGVLHPLTVNREGEGLAVLDGLKRLRALADEPERPVPVRIVTLDPAGALAALVTFNRAHRGLCDLEEAWVVRALVREQRLRQSQVAALLGHHKSWVCRRLQLAERLEQSVADDMRLGLLSSSVARELVRLPRGNQSEAAASVQRHGLTSRQAAELVARLTSAELGADVSALLEDPLRYLDSAARSPVGAQSTRDARLSDAGEALRRAMEGLARQARIAERTIASPHIGRVLCSDLQVLRSRLRDVAQTLEQVLMSLNALLEDESVADA